MCPLLLQVDGLHVTYPTVRGGVQALRGVNLAVEAGETLGLVGESGSGKTTLCRAMLRLLPRRARTTGRVLFEGTDLLAADLPALRGIRGRRIGLVPQGAMSALNPTIKVGAQVIESIHAHTDTRGPAAREQARALFEAAGLEPRVLDLYPHELSGGMRQRAVIATTLAADADVLIVDEPTTGLDVVVQSQILDLLRRFQEERGLTVILSSHDLRLILAVCDRVAVMYGGRIMETSRADKLAADPGHPYSAGLLASLPPDLDEIATTSWQSIPGRSPDPSDPPRGCAFHPRCPHAFEDCRSGRPPTVETAGRQVACLLHTHGDPPDELFPRPDGYVPAPTRTAPDRDQPDHVTTQDVAKVFVQRRGVLRRRVITTALDGVDLSLRAGETVGLVGESGSGKTTLARLLLRLSTPTSGTITVGGHRLEAMTRSELRRYRRQTAMITQDPYDALHPALPVARLVTEPLDIAGSTTGSREQSLIEALTVAGLTPTDDLLTRRPEELSGGQQQRVALARALINDPTLLIADEPTSMLDASIRGSILNTLRDLKQQDFTMLLITHDLAEAAYLSDRIYVLRDGQVVDHGTTDGVLLDHPHAYTRRLLEATQHPQDPVL